MKSCPSSGAAAIPLPRVPLLMERFAFSEAGTQAILDMRLARPDRLERDKLQAEYDELEKNIAYYKEPAGR